VYDVTNIVVDASCGVCGELLWERKTPAK